MIDQIEKVLEVMKTDYYEWTVTKRKHNKSEYSNEEYARERCTEYNNGLGVVEGSRYYKIISNRGDQRTVAGFVVKEGHPKFKEGDLLKAATWNAPAKNFARGNVFDENSYKTDSVRWTGIR